MRAPATLDRHADRHADKRIDSPAGVKSTRCLVLGGTRTPSEGASAFQRVDFPEDPYDAIVILGSADAHRMRSDLMEAIVRGSNPAAPIIASSKQFGAMVDFDLPNDGAYTIAAALLLAQPLIKRVAALPPILRGPDRDRLLALAIAYTRDIALEAAWSPDDRKMISYARLPGVFEPRSVLEELADSSLFRRRYFDQLFVCARCDSSRLLAREVCVKCHTSDIEKQALLHHYSCGFQGPEPLFGDHGSQSCPKCKKQLRHYGLDYDKPGITYKCRGCNDVMSEPDVYFVCADCHSNQPSDGAARKVWCHYDITSDGIAAVKAGVLSRNDNIASGAGISLRDFRLMTRQMLSLSTRYSHPISAFLMTIGGSIFDTKEAPTLMEEARLFALEIAKEHLRPGDVVAVVRDGLVVCLPEADETEAKRVATKIQSAAQDTVQQAVVLNFQFYIGEKITAMLEALL